MDDRIFELTEKMYVEFTKRFIALEDGQKELTQRVTKIENNLEHDIKERLQVLHEREGINTVKLDEHTQRLNEIDKKLDYIVLSINSQDKRLSIVEKSKKKVK